MAAFDDLILAGRESTNLEYKRSAPWQELRIAIIRTVLGMANTRDGGHIVVGVVENSDGTFLAEGVKEEHLETFPTEEDFQAAVNGFAEPFIDPRVNVEQHQGRSFLVVTVLELEEQPILCTKAEGHRLKEGALYVRSRRKPETVEVRTPTDMRALMRLATDKALGRELERLRALGLLPEERARRDTDEAPFAKQREDIGDGHPGS